MNMNRVYALATFTFGMTVCVLVCEAQDGETKVNLSQVPAKVKAAIVAAVGDGQLVDIGQIKSGGETVYEIEMVVDGKEFDVSFDRNGNVLEKSEEGPADSPESDADENGEPDVKPESKGKANAQTEGNKQPMGGQTDATRAATFFQDDFDLEHRQFATTGRNRYFVLEPGYKLVLKGKDGNEDAQLEITVLDETKTVAGIDTRVVEERETVGGELVEISRNFYAICKQTGSVFYFGEEVDIYKDGKVVSHEGAWLHGQDHARAGMMMPGECLVGAAFQQEIAPGKAMDRGKIVDVLGKMQTPAGKFNHCLKMWEENPIDGDSETKTYAPGVGLIQDENLLLVQYGPAKRRP